MAALRAGTGARLLEPPLGAPMMGYGARTGVALGRHDPLFARALYLAADSDLLIVACDVCLLAPAQAEALGARIAARSGVSAERIAVTATHTHSGPETGLIAVLAGREPPPYVPALEDAIVEAGCEAVRSAALARLGFGRAEAKIGINRRRADGPVDREVLVLRVDGEDGTPRAVVWMHGCHPTALGHDNLHYSADWPGAAHARVAERLPGALSMFLLTAHADVDPRTRGLLDLAVPGQSAGVDFATCAALGREIGAAVADAALATETRDVAEIGAASAHIAVPTWRADEAGRRDALVALGLPEDSALGTAALFAAETERTAGFALAERRARRARVRRYLRDRTAFRFAGSALPEVRVQVLRIGDARLLALPCEPTVDVGRDWKQRSGAPHAALLSIANGWLRYLPHPRNFAESGAEAHYEVLQSTFVPDAAERLLALGAALAAEAR